MLMPGRRYSAGSGYRYGFNGKENDNEVKGEGNQYDYGFRIYDPRIGRFLSVDPLMKAFPFYTPYQFGGNTPIRFVDIDGREPLDGLIVLEKLIFGTNHIEKVEQGFTERAVETVAGIFSPKSLPESLKKVLLGPHRLATTDPTVAKAYTNSLWQAGSDVAKMGQDAAKGIIKDYANLIKRAAKGDEKAIGALGFEAVMLLAPGGEETKGVSGGRFLTKTFEEGTFNAERISTLGLKDGMEVGWKKGIELAEDFLGAGYSEVEKGRFVSKDGIRQVRMGEHELSGKQPLHLNFETLKRNRRRPSKMTIDKNLHVYLKE